MPGLTEPSRRRWQSVWPWVVLALAVFPAVYHFYAFDTGPDAEFPGVRQMTFSPRPPAAYRLAEPGDTIDRAGLYIAVAAVVLATIGWIQNRRVGRSSALWPAALGLAIAAAWDCATPWPTFDGWHGLNWRAIGDASTPRLLRALLSGSAVALTTWVVLWTGRAWKQGSVSISEGRSKGILGLLIVGFVLVVARLAEFPDVEPMGYWPRWAFDWGLLAFSIAMLRSIPRAENFGMRLGFTLGAVVAWGVLVGGGLWVVWYHRPLERLHTVVPGKIYISAMPTPRGLDVAQRRHHFKTVINVFNEATHERSPILPDELAWIKKHGLQYFGSPSDPLKSDAFLNKTLSLAEDPDAWPILLHCHGCMDRSVAWMGIYRFVVQKRPLDEIFQEIEAHRGLRPKASVTLLYNRVLEPRAPEHYEADPSAPILRESARGCTDPYYEEIRRAMAGREEKAEPERRLSRLPDDTARP